MKRWWRSTVTGVLFAGLVACGGAGVPADDDGLGDGGGGTTEDEQYWELVLTADDTTITGTSVVLVSDRVIALSESTPPGWTVTLGADETFELGVTYISGNLSDNAFGLIQAPSGATCEVPVDATGSNFVTLTVASIEGDVPTGFATFLDTTPGCLASEVQGGGGIGFGVP
jgi:hypothetical protein